MKNLGTILVALMIFGCAVKKLPVYTDLSRQDEECGQKVYPCAQGKKCPSGEFSHFTIRRLVEFGERPVWSPDGNKIAFMEKEFGEAYEYDFAGGQVKCLTCGFKHQGFLRIHYLKDGDYLLLGPKKHGNDFLDRVFHTGFFWMPADLSQAPKWIGEEHYEGVAVSRESRKIAYTRTWLDSPFHFPSALYVAELMREGKIVNRKAVYFSVNLIEAQDFLPGERGITFTRYTPTYEAFGIDLETGKVTNYSQSPASEEPEGIFPDGKFTLMESDRHAMNPGDMDLDLYMLRLDGTGKDVRRLTRFSDTPGEKASNPSVSPEGCRIAFMKSKKSADPQKLTGEGGGIFLLEFYERK